MELLSPFFCIHDGHTTIIIYKSKDILSHQITIKSDYKIASKNR